MSLVLVVEDEPDIGDVFAEIVRLEGHEPILAPNGEIACKLARSARPALIFMDLVMPVMSGTQAMCLIRADPITRQIPIIATSVARPDLDTIGLLADDFLPKPFNVSDVESLIKRYLVERQPAL